MSDPKMNQAAMLEIMDEISRNAEHLSFLVSKVGDAAGEPTDVEILAAAAEIMVRRIGWMSDRVRAYLRGNSADVAGADFWMMPGTFNGEAYAPIEHRRA